MFSKEFSAEKRCLARLRYNQMITIPQQKRIVYIITHSLGDECIINMEKLEAMKTPEEREQYIKECENSPRLNEYKEFVNNRRYASMYKNKVLARIHKAYMHKKITVAQMEEWDEWVDKCFDKSELLKWEEEHLPKRKCNRK